MIRARTFKRVGALVLALAAMPAMMWIASASAADVNIAANVPGAVQMTTPAPVTIDAVIESTVTVSTTSDVKANKTWQMSVEADQNPTDSSIPASLDNANLTFDSSDSRGLGTGKTDEVFTVGSPKGLFATGSEPTKTGSLGDEVQIDYKLYTDFDDEQGTYTAVHTYTLTII